MDRQGFAHLPDDLARVQGLIADVVHVADERLQEPCARLAHNAGKMFRTSLVLTSAYLFAPDEPASDEVVRGATMVELLHIATLYHDDVCDRGLTRRGQPTVNATYGDAIAILCGDYLLACCTRLASELGDDVMRLFGETLAALSHGQLLETTQAYDVTRSEADYFAAVDGKTARLISSSSALGAILAARDEPQREAVADYGRQLGVAFQIWDDLLDLWPARETGKQRFSDLLNGIYNLPVILGLQTHPELGHALTAGPLGLDQCEEIATCLEQWGARVRSEDTAAAYVRAGLGALARLDGPAREATPRLLDVVRASLPEVAPLLSVALAPDSRTG